MVLKRVLWLYILWVLTVGIGFTKEKLKFPTYYRSNPSTRFVNLEQSQSRGLKKESLSSFHATLPDTLKVMAIRVQFQRDNDRNTTGDGWFDLTEGDSMINPPPHNQEYFFNQLRALRDYYTKVSNSKLFLQVQDENKVGFVYPLESDSVWTLPHEMSYYNPDETEELLDQRLAELFRDAIVIADENSNIDFSKFDCLIIFHAGVGWEFTQEFDTTPNDIPSVFLNFNDLKKSIGKNSPDFKGIPVNNGTRYVKEGIILPETENQSGYKFFGLLGTAALMMGHQLGLPNLFDTDTGHPGIGRFGLMDQGSGNFFGNIPTQPCAWSKIFLGWEEPIEVVSGNQLPVAASLTTDPNKIYKIPINAKEYFLIENRQRTVRETRNIGVGYDENGTRIEFYDDGTFNPQTGFGVIVSVEEYDFGLPGSGILIWHIDENVIEQKYAENLVNSNMNHRGVDLVEADGSQDMGYFFNNFGFTGYHSGYAEDMWWDRNEAHLFANSSGKVMFTPFTMPSSQAHSRANTGIYITEFSGIDSVMYFTLEIKYYQSGFPAFLGDNSGTSAIVAGDLNSDGQNEIVAATHDGKILVWKANGEKFIENQDSTYQVKINGDTIKLPLAIFAAINNGQLPNSPSLADLDNDGDMEVIAGSQNGRLYAWQALDQDGNGRGDLFFEINCGAPISTVPVIGDWYSSANGLEIAIGLSNGDLCLVQQTGDIIWKKNISNAQIVGLAGIIDSDVTGLIVIDQQNNIFLINKIGEINWQNSRAGFGSLSYPAVGDVNNDGHLEIIVSTKSGYLFIMNNAGDFLTSSHSISVGSPLSNPTLADIDNDGYLDIVFIGGGSIFAYRYTGVLLTDFPILIERGYEDQIYPDPILVDINGDKKVEIIVGTMSSQLMAFDYQGKKIERFPLSVSQPIVSSPLITGLDHHGKLNLIARSNDNYCYVWQLDFQIDPAHIFWGQFLKDAQHTGLYLERIDIPTKESDLMPEKMVYNYPNPTEGNSTTIRYYLRDAAEVSIRIYDMAGELVKEFSGPGLPAIENEVNWDITNIQSGVYLARVQAKDIDETNVAIIKIAVVK